MYLCSENKGADQLPGYRAADLCLYFTYVKSWFFLMIQLIWKNSIGNVLTVQTF